MLMYYTIEYTFEDGSRLTSEPKLTDDEIPFGSWDFPLIAAGAHEVAPLVQEFLESDLGGVLTWELGDITKVCVSEAV